MAAAAAEEHHDYIEMKKRMENFASRAAFIQFRSEAEEAEEVTSALIRDMISYGRLIGVLDDK